MLPGMTQEYPGIEHLHLGDIGRVPEIELLIGLEAEETKATVQKGLEAEEIELAVQIGLEAEETELAAKIGVSAGRRVH